MVAAPARFVAVHERVVAPHELAVLPRRAARPFWRSVAGGCDLDCDVVGGVRRAGLLPIEITRFPVPTSTVPLRPCVALVARHARWTPGARP